MIKVFVVEDSAVARDLLTYVLSSDPQIEVIGTASSGEEAIAAVARLKPDVITMDIHLPGMNGIDATRKIMETQPTPIIIVSSSGNTSELASTFRVVDAGALAVLPRPNGFGHPEHETAVQELINHVKLMSEVKVVRRWARSPGPDADRRLQTKPAQKAEIRLIAIGASTGGPVVLQTILAALPAGFPVPLVVVQHIAQGFVSGFATWLDQTTRCSVHVATDGESIQPGHVYLAPDNFQMAVSRNGRIVLSANDAENTLCPSVAHLFRSVADAYGASAVGVLLSGMGKDGAAELALMKQRGSITLAQDEASSVVHGMPGEAIKQGGATFVLPPERIAATLISLVDK